MENFDVFSCLLLLHSSARIYTSRANTRAKRTEKQKKWTAPSWPSFSPSSSPRSGSKTAFLSAWCCCFCITLYGAFIPFLSLKADDVWFSASLFDDDYLLSRGETSTKETRKAFPINWPTYSFFYLTFLSPNGDENTTQRVHAFKERFWWTKPSSSFDSPNGERWKGYPRGWKKGGIIKPTILEGARRKRRKKSTRFWWTIRRWKRFKRTRCACSIYRTIREGYGKRRWNGKRGGRRFWRILRRKLLTDCLRCWRRVSRRRLEAAVEEKEE